MKRQWFLLVLVLSSTVGFAQDDLTLIYRTRLKGVGTAPFEDGAKLTVYIQGRKLRQEYALNTPLGPSRSISIHRCDLGRVFTIIPATKNYLERRFTTATGRNRLPSFLQEQAQDGTPINYEVQVSTQASNETKQMFGFTAIRYRRRVHESPTNGLVIRARNTDESTWLADIPAVEPCYLEPLGPEFGGELNRFDESRIRARVQFTGERAFGIEFSNEQVISVFMPGDDAQKQHAHDRTVSIELVDLRRGRLDPTLFDIPPRGYTKSKPNRR